VTTRRLPNKTTLRYLLRHRIGQFFLLAMGAGENFLADNAARIGRIREQGYKILVIDDDDDFRKSFCFKLKRKYKAHVEEVVSGEAGIEKLSEGNSYDFIFTDIMMPPGISGIETYHKLRKLDGHIRIVIMSAYSDSDDWKRAQELADVPLLHKPIPEEQLITILGA